MDNNHHHNNNTMDDTTMIRYLLGKYGMSDLVAMLRSAAASGKVPLLKRPNAATNIVQNRALPCHQRRQETISTWAYHSKRTQVLSPSPMPAR